MIRPQLVFVHGWGFGPAFWEPLRTELSANASTALDLGFFEPEQPDELGGSMVEVSHLLDAPSGPLVAVGHSLGVPWLLRQSRFRFEALVSLGGFGRFDVPPGPVRAMRRGLTRNANRILAAFHQSCGLPPHLVPDSSTARPDRLAEGLDWLLAWDERPALASLGLPVLALAAKDDAVVLPALSRASFPHGLDMLPKGGHAFPATRPGECARLIAAFLANL